jgi:hypothetical protein
MAERVADTLTCRRTQTPEEILAPDDLARCEAIGAALAAGLALGVF